jgi:3-hydroxyisobutyrate dehydrogenase
MNTIGFVGVGRMGSNMALRLRDQGYVIGATYDIRPWVSRELAAEVGATPCDRLSQVTGLCDIVITVVSDDAAMRSIFGLEGAADHLLLNAAGKVFVNCPTISPRCHLDVEKAALAAGARSLEACMASSIPQARQGTLYLMVAGDEAVLKEVEPILRRMSAALRYVGPTGEAAKVKALVNMVMNINTAGLAEGLALGDALGLDLTMLREIFSQTGANSRVLETDGEDMQNREHSCYFSAAHAAKDSGIALDLARTAALCLPLAEATKQQYDRMVVAGIGDIDKSGIAELTFLDRAKTHQTPAK